MLVRLEGIRFRGLYFERRLGWGEGGGGVDVVVVVVADGVA